MGVKERIRRELQSHRACGAWTSCRDKLENVDFLSTAPTRIELERTVVEQSLVAGDPVTTTTRKDTR